MSIKIEFIDITNEIDSRFWPIPAKRQIPEWYKKLSPYKNNTKDIQIDSQNTTATVKKCIPVFDAITAGYIIPFPTDILVRIVEGKTVFQWPDFEMVRFQKAFQIDGHPNTAPGEDVPKWKNPWAIITPKGYSCYITSPLHRESPFSILEGVVDTDTYFNPIQFPFVMKDPDWVGVIPAGSPMVQIIPFKREKFIMSVEKDKISKVIKSNRLINSKFIEGYKKLFWSRKEYE